MEADPNVDNWNPATEEGDPAALGNRVAPTPLAAPVIDDAIPIFAADGVRLSLEVTGPARPDLTWVAHWKLSAATVWGADEIFTEAGPGPNADLLTSVVPPDSSIDVRVSYGIGDGRYSPWSTPQTVSTSTASVAPAAPTDLGATGGTGSADVTWRNPNSVNFNYARVYRGTTAVFGSASDVSGPLPGGLGAVVNFVDNPSAGTYYYWVRAFNSAGTPSPTTGPVSAVVT